MSEFILPWNEDEEGHYLAFRTNEGLYEVRRSNTDLYLHGLGHTAIDHLFIEIEDNGETSTGYRLWRGLFDNALGEGMFDVCTEEMTERGFLVIWSDVPTGQDIHYWQEYYQQEYQPVEPPAPKPVNEIDCIVGRLTAHLAEAWKYYEPEWSGRIAEA